MKTLPNKSKEWMSALTTEEASNYKNRFVCYELKNGILKLTFFLNPYQSHTTHRAVATKKFMSMNRTKGFAKKTALFLNVDRSQNHLHTYIYQVDANINEEVLKKEINDFKNELKTNEALNRIMTINSNKPYALCLALKETDGKYNELEKKIIFEKNTGTGYAIDVEIVRSIAKEWEESNFQIAA